MPIYKFLNTETNEEYEEFMFISEMEEYLENNPHVTILVNGAPMVTGTFGRNSVLPKPKQKKKNT